MEIRTAIGMLRKLMCISACMILVLLLQVRASAQVPVNTVKEGKMYIELSKHLSEAVLDSFIKRYDLADLALKFFIKTGQQDTLKLLGWHIDKNDNDLFAISKPLLSSEDLTNLAGKIMFTEKQPGIDALFPAINNGLLYGYNRYKNRSSFAIQDSVVTFYLRNKKDAVSVKLAGSFNNWHPERLSMTKTDSGWIANVKLAPGKYWYKFIADGRWLVDEDNLQRENDGEGNINSVFYKTNYVFKLNGHTEAKKVYLSGSFNKWQPKELLMQRTATGWELPIYLADGTHTYKFVIDGSWQVDPANPERYPNEFNDFNSVIHLGNEYLFRLKGYETAKQVLLTGTFNGWRKDELFMKRTDSGWVLPYSLGPGNYEYRFIVEHTELIDPANPLVTSDDSKMANSYLILDPNYTFRLKGYASAKKVFLAGDFNNYAEHSLAMKQVGNEWVFSVHLTRGKHIYKFIVDGQWIRDPENKLWEQNRYGTGDSVIWFGE
ncbi:MAG: glycogen-binding domain-containing protein [Ferruginibacter sp.]